MISLLKLLPINQNHLHMYMRCSVGINILRNGKVMLYSSSTDTVFVAIIRCTKKVVTLASLALNICGTKNTTSTVSHKIPLNAGGSFFLLFLTIIIL